MHRLHDAQSLFDYCNDVGLISDERMLDEERACELLQVFQPRGAQASEPLISPTAFVHATWLAICGLSSLFVARPLQPWPEPLPSS
jgi:hypothetical protein